MTERDDTKPNDGPRLTADELLALGHSEMAKRDQNPMVGRRTDAPLKSALDGKTQEELREIARQAIAVRNNVSALRRVDAPISADSFTSPEDK